MDVNGNGLLSLAEVDKGMRDVVKLPIISGFKPVLMRAFMAAKTMVKAKTKNDEDFISKGEFRYLLKYLRQYYELWIAFDQIDTSHDHRVSHNEFLKCKPILESWGIDMSNPEAQWKKADSDGGGMILFIEFCDWAIKNQIDLTEDDDDDKFE